MHGPPLAYLFSVGPLSHFRQATLAFFGPLLPFSPSVFDIIVIFTINFLAILPFLGHIGPILVTSGQFWSHQANMGHIGPI